MKNNNNYRVEAFMGQVNGPLPPNFSNFHTTMPLENKETLDSKKVFVSTVWDLQKKHPDLYKNFVRSLATEINNQSRNSSERIRKNIKECGK